MTAQSSQSAPLIPASSYIPSLDGIRAVAVVIVFLSHIHFTKLIPGGFGVTIFFVLSGYLITTLLAREYDREGRIAFGAFYLRRLLRLSPPLLITLVFTFALYFAGWTWGVFDPYVVLSQIFYYFNYYNLYGAGAGEANTIAGLDLLWSLSVEEHFYMIWPLMFLAVARKSIGIPHIIALIIGILIWRAIRVFAFGTGEWAIHTSTDTRFDMLLFGCLLALLNWRGLSARIFPGGWTKYAVIALAIAVILTTFVLRTEGFRLTLRYTLQGIALMPLLYYAVTDHKSLLFQPLNWAPMRMIGVYSYTIYLSHFVIMQALIHTGIAADGTLKLGLIAAVLTLAYSAAMYRWVDIPFHHLRKRVSANAKTRAASA